MNENAKKWVEALRSGNYKQAKNKLQSGDAYCCLGVACKIYEDETKEFLPRDVNGEYARHTLCFSFSVVSEWIGIQSARGEFYKYGILNSLTDLNDNGKSFEYIADIIESESKELFVDE